MEDQIKILRLVTGEDIICKYLKLEKQLYYVIDPMTLVIRYKSGESTILMQHWLPVEVLEKNEVTLQDRDILRKNILKYRFLQKSIFVIKVKSWFL